VEAHAITRSRRRAARGALKLELTCSCPRQGINRAVAVAALAKCKDVEDAAEAIFAGKFAHIAEESDGEGSSQLAESYEEDEGEWHAARDVKIC
jgi:hypothetical protein